MITLAEYLGDKVQRYATEYNDAIAVNTHELLWRVNDLLAAALRHDIVVERSPTTGTQVVSGWRPPSYNATVPGAAQRSRHMTGQAIDLHDPDGALDEWLLQNQDILRANKLVMEHPAATKGWCHLQSVAVKSGNTVFYP